MGTKAKAALGLVALTLLGTGLWLALRPPPPNPGILEVNGRIEGDQAAVGAKIGGTLVRIPVEEGDQVAEGVLIAELDSRQARARLERAEHDLHTAREQLASAEAQVVSVERRLEAARIAVTQAERESRARVGEAQAALGAARARLRHAQAESERATADYARYRELFESNAVSAQTLDQARATEKVAEAAVESAREQVNEAQEALERARATGVSVELRRKEVEAVQAELEEARTAVTTARARVQAREADVALARAEHDDLRVHAPFAGTVLERLVEPGEVLAAGTPLVTLVDLSRLYAKVYVAERDIGKVELDAPARVYTDAFPERYFDADVSQVSQQAEFTPRDVHMKDERTRLVFAVKLALHNPRGILKPGMPVDARIRWDPEASWGDRLE
ncbi:MAG: HlyD family efflux transporter periplasmic adaptor subunit [Gammaproteobacteria bacterium]|nr:HlyD family efflux transporter periplasmic adaptor subunit [Gammaproteobacteria bacterium]NIR84362.1 HlyD family efflux transporter periplasmic adaptor subunit [Gammaproteobacteria bacterium]NIR89878.1 HlyD family efflux transporter periplasmic adaptor subunit [Gammaproteobacteria bacterium]NIU05745.1 HlyD family efflux transporter periplasmic adaptor subunit [Gammaproteobacteria bacterium]NIV52505.1 HlyD family efflux transporter periplasmic adaptor subunit [Gammaproteobacteria bacterium]